MTTTIQDFSDERHQMEGAGVYQVNEVYSLLGQATLELSELIAEAEGGFCVAVEDFDKLVVSVRRSRSLLKIALTCHTEAEKEEAKP